MAKCRPRHPFFTGNWHYRQEKIRGEPKSTVESTLELMNDRLHIAMSDWIKKNEEAIGPRWAKLMKKELAKADQRVDINPATLLGDAMWILQMVSAAGVQAGYTMGGPRIEHIPANIDEASTKRVLYLGSATLGTQFMMGLEK